MNKVISSVVVLLFFSAGSFASGNYTTIYTCQLGNKGTKAFLKISETKDSAADLLSANAELIFGSQLKRSIPQLQKQTNDVPGFPSRKIVVWTGKDIKITWYLDHSFPGRSFAADLEILNQPKVQGVCEF